jgi:hypothetical protein
MQIQQLRNQNHLWAHVDLVSGSHALKSDKTLESQ